MTPVEYNSPPIRPTAREPEKEPEKPEEPEVAEVPVEQLDLQEQIAMVEESFEFDNIEDEIDHQVNTFFVILGSFGVSDNANNFKTKLENEGFNPVILLSETGLNRLSIDSYSQEADARQRVLDIRRAYPEYNDAWLLIRRID